MRLYLILIPFFLSTVSACAQERECGIKDKRCLTRSGFPACRSRIDLDKYYEFLKSGKKESAENIISGNEDCITLKAGDEVIVQYYDADKFKIFFRGPEKSYWVSSKALYGISE